MTMTIALLKSQSHKSKPQGADDMWSLLWNLYNDSSRAHTQGRLSRLGMGIPDNEAPIEVGVVRRIVDRLGVTYDRAPARFLKAKGDRLKESNPAHKQMIETVSAMQYDLVWDAVDKARALLRQVALRFYPNPTTGSVEAQMFSPNHIERDFTGGSPSHFDGDQSFALKLTPSGGFTETWELWRKGKDGRWRVLWVNERTEAIPAERQIFGSQGIEKDELGFISPYPILPVQMIYDQLPMGKAWLHPRSSRAGWNDSINAVLNDLLALVQMQAHAREVYKSDNPKDSLPSKRGPGTAIRIPVDSSLEYHTPQPNIDACISTLREFERMMTLNEDLPVSELSPEKNILTGAALKVEERPLAARRRRQVPLAHQDERMAWRRVVAVHNVHASQLKQPIIDPKFDMVVELAAPQAPLERSQILEDGASAMALGVDSLIDVIMRSEGCNRSEAEERAVRVKEDNKKYPPLGNPGAQKEGPRDAGVDATPTDIDRALNAQGDERKAPRADIGTSDSVVQAIERKTA